MKSTDVDQQFNITATNVNNKIVNPFIFIGLKRTIVLRPFGLNHWSGIIRLNRPTRNVPPNPIRVEWLTI
jgi:hypothetical protein